MDYLTSPDLGEYTYEQKLAFDHMIETDDALEMYVLSQNMEERHFVKLYHSFEKGGKGKYQMVVDRLLVTGFRLFNEYVNTLVSDEFWDDGTAEELKLEVSPQAWELIKQRAR